MSSTIIRRKKQEWTNVDNRIINDTRLNLKSLGLLVYMLSKPNDWQFSQEHLGSVWGEGREAMRSMMKTLQACGYVQRELVRDEQGRIRTLTIVSETPDTGFPYTVGASPDTGYPSPVEPTPVDPPLGQPAPLVTTDFNKRLKNKRLKEIPPIAPQGGEQDRFEIFWKDYPRKVGKDAARRAFEKRNVTDALLQQMLDALAVQKRSTDWKKDGGQFIPHPSTWLNQGRWQDELASGAPEAGGSGDYRDDDPEAWGMSTAAQRAAAAGMPAWNNVEASMGRMPDFDTYKRFIHSRLTQRHAA